MNRGQVGHAAQILLREPAGQRSLLQLIGPDKLRPAVGAAG